MTSQSGGGGGYAGVTSDGQVPGGLRVAGALHAGDAAAVDVPTLHELWGTINILLGQAGIDDFDGPLNVAQLGSLAADGARATLQLTRALSRHGHAISIGALRILVSDIGGTVPLGEPVADFGAAVVNFAGFIGLGGKTPPTAGQTLAQSVIDAITDANAKTATQALADALSDMGAVTLT